MGEDYKQEVSRRLRELSDLLNQGKFEEVVQNYYTDDAISVEPGKKPFRAKDGMVDMYRRSLRIPGDVFRIDCVEIYKKDDCVIERLWYSVKDKERKILLEGNSFHIWKQLNGEWCLDLDMWN